MVIREITSIDTLIEKHTAKKNVCAYARVSTLKDVAHLSFDMQVQTYTQLITKNPEWNFIGVYADEGKSGTNTHKRTSFMNMLELAKNGFIDLIITKSISRFSRNVVDTLSILQDLRKANVEVFFENENISSFDPKIEFVISVLSGMAEEEARNVSENVKWNVRKRFSEGKFYLVTKGLLGYTRDNNGQLIIDEDEAQTVKRIYQMYTEGIGVTSIVKWLNEHNIKTTYNKGKWYGNAIYNILKNEKYTGNALLQKTVRPSFKAKLKIKNETLPMYYVENSHPEIISQVLFDKAQAIRLERIQKYHHYVDRTVLKDKYNTPSKYAGKIKCGHCGKFYIQRKGNSGTEYSSYIMMCPSNKMKKSCPGDNISVMILNQVIKQQVNWITNNKKELLNLVSQALETNPQRLTLLNDKQATNAQIKALEEKLAAIASFDDEFNLEVKLKLEEDLLLLKRKLFDISNRLAIEFDHVKKVAFLNSKIDKNVDKVSLFNEIIDYIKVNNKNNLNFNLKGISLGSSTVITKKNLNYMFRHKENSLEYLLLL